MTYGQLVDEIETLEDQGGEDMEEDVRFLEFYRQKRMEEMREAALKAKFGSYGEVTKSDWTHAVNNAGDGVYVVVHLAQKGCDLRWKAKLIHLEMKNLPLLINTYES